MLLWAAGLLAASPLLARGKRLWAENQRNRNLPLAKWEKLYTGAYLILRDYAEVRFPPRFGEQAEVYKNEINTRFTTPGVLENYERAEMAKPFWQGPLVGHLLKAFLRLIQALERAQLHPPAKLLELGGGAGWTAEFLVQFGFKVVSTTLSQYDSTATRKRAEALRTKGLEVQLEAVVAPMESVSEYVIPHCPFDAVFVFEALHHAFDWRATISSASQCLRPGGWLLICNEPNLLHTAISYRVALLTNTHEVGLRRSELIRQMKSSGFERIISMGKCPHLWFRPHWLLAQKGLATRKPAN